MVGITPTVPLRAGRCRAKGGKLYTRVGIFSLLPQWKVIVPEFPNVRFMQSVAAAGQFPADEGIEIAFAGRSNSGKSTAINAIVRRAGLARASRTPGRTQLLNYFEVEPGRRIVDLPGYGYAKVPDAERRKWAPLLDALVKRASLRGMILIVDARRGLSDADERLIAWADPARRPLHVLLSKADKLSQAQARSALRVAEAALTGRASVQLFSATSGRGVEDGQRLLRRWLK